MLMTRRRHRRANTRGLGDGISEVCQPYMESVVVEEVVEEAHDQASPPRHRHQEAAMRVRSLSYPNEACMTISVEAVPECRGSARSEGDQVSERVHDELDRCCGVRREDHVKVLRISLHEFQHELSDTFNPKTREIGRVRGGVRVAKEIRRQVKGDGV
ncbi:hypothetical protein MRB53_040624 [Persea americana]|nr:hypothetical protein MRB53_040624 [Persea americana]